MRIAKNDQPAMGLLDELVYLRSTGMEVSPWGQQRSTVTAKLCYKFITLSLDVHRHIRINLINGPYVLTDCERQQDIRNR